MIKRLDGHRQLDCDVLVIGAGAGGLSAAIAAKKGGLNVVVVEKASCFGGTTALSGGVLWIPGNSHGATGGARDSRDAARRYLRHEVGANYDDKEIEAFLDYGPEMLEFFERETDVKFVPTLYPDYHPDRPGGVLVGRSVVAAPYDIRALGEDRRRLRMPLRTITFMGMMFNSSNGEIKHFFNVTRSLRSAWYVAKRVAAHVLSVAAYGQAVNVTSGNALAARLAKSALDLGIPIITDAPVQSLIRTGDRISGAVVSIDGEAQRIAAGRAVVLACGGFSHDVARRALRYEHVARGGVHLSPVPATNTGDGIALAETVGGRIKCPFPSAAAWMPVSHVPFRDGTSGVFPHLLDRYKPGVIGVTQDGLRFTNESNSYHDVGEALIEACRGRAETAMWLVCDHTTLRKYGLGYAKPAPVPLGPLIRSGYLLKGQTLQALAERAGIDAQGLIETVTQFNRFASAGDDPEFGRGTTAFNRYLGDPEHQPNPCVNPVANGPFYAVKVLMGDLGTFEGIKTNVVGQVVDAADRPIDGLYSVGNDRASMMGGRYPGAGITLGPIMTFGYLAGRHICAMAPPPSCALHVAGDGVRASV